MRPVRGEEDIDELLRSAKALAVITAWNELGLFDKLAGGPKTIDELSVDRRALEVTIPVLKHLGLLFDAGDRIALSPAAVRMHEGKQLPTQRNLDILRGIAQMDDVVRRGGPLSENDATNGGVVEDPERAARFLDMLYGASSQSTEQVYDALSPLLSARSRMLDVGGGHGRYSRRFADAGHTATLFDFPHVVEYAQERHGEALGYIAGNFRDESADFGGPYDLVFLSNIVHGEPDQENRSLIARLASTLAPGGRLVIKDMFLDEHGDNPENAVFFGLTMLYYTRGGQSPGVAQARGWLEAGGLVEPALATFDRYQLLHARKP
jgi:SAM-dependent methyltransferase